MNEEKYVEMLENGELYDYITNLQQELEEYKDTEKYSKRFLYKAIEELEIWKPKDKVIKLEIDYLLNILKGGVKDEEL